MAWYPVRHARDGLHLEHSLWFGAEGDGRFEGILDAMIAEKLEKIRGVLVDDDVCARDVDAKAIWEELFLVLRNTSALLCAQVTAVLTLAIKVFSRSDRFFSEASANGTSITSAICCPSPSRNLALNEPAGPACAAVTSCWI